MPRPELISSIRSGHLREDRQVTVSGLPDSPQSLAKLPTSRLPVSNLDNFLEARFWPINKGSHKGVYRYRSSRFVDYSELPGHPTK